MKLNNSELKVMDILWEENPITAKEVSLRAAERYQWNKNTTYTILKALVEKKYVSRTEPNFTCEPLLEMQAVQRNETRGLIDRLFGGSPSAFLSAFYETENLSQKQIDEIQKIIDNG